MHPSIGVCYVRNQLTAEQLPSILYPAFISALMLRAIDEQIATCLFTEATPQHVASAHATLLSLMGGSSSTVRMPFDQILPAGLGFDRLRPKEKAALDELRNTAGCTYLKTGQRFPTVDLGDPEWARKTCDCVLCRRRFDNASALPTKLRTWMREKKSAG